MKEKIHNFNLKSFPHIKETIHTVISPLKNYLTSRRKYIMSPTSQRKYVISHLNIYPTSRRKYIISPLKVKFLPDIRFYCRIYKIKEVLSLGVLMVKQNYFIVFVTLKTYFTIKHIKTQTNCTNFTKKPLVFWRSNSTCWKGFWNLLVLSKKGFSESR